MDRDDFDCSLVLCRIIDRLVFLGVYEPFPSWKFFDLTGEERWINRREGYYIIRTEGLFGKDNCFLPAYSVFRVQQDPVFGWYFKEVKF